MPTIAFVCWLRRTRPNNAVGLTGSGKWTNKRNPSAGCILRKNRTYSWGAMGCLARRVCCPTKHHKIIGYTRRYPIIYPRFGPNFGLVYLWMYPGKMLVQWLRIGKTCWENPFGPKDHPLSEEFLTGLRRLQNTTSGLLDSEKLKAEKRVACVFRPIGIRLRSRSVWVVG